MRVVGPATLISGAGYRPGREQDASVEQCYRTAETLRARQFALDNRGRAGQVPGIYCCWSDVQLDKDSLMWHGDAECKAKEVDSFAA